MKREEDVSTTKGVESGTNEESTTDKDEKDTFERASDLVRPPYACVVKYDKPGPTALFQKQNYMVSLNVGIEVNRMILTVHTGHRSMVQSLFQRFECRSYLCYSM